MTEWGPWISIAIRTAVLGLALYHAKHVVEEYLEHGDARGLRDVILAGIVIAGVAAIWWGGFVALDEGLRGIGRVIGIIASGALLVGLLAIAVSHRLEGNCRP